MSQFSRLFLDYKDKEAFTEEIKREKLIGKGSYGAVYRAVHSRTGTQIALKCLEVMSDELDDLMVEISIMRECECPFIVTFFGNFLEYGTESNKMWIMMEYCHLGSAKDVMDDLKKGFTETQICAIARNMLGGLFYLHSKLKIHRDIKADNVLINIKGEAKLGTNK